MLTVFAKGKIYMHYRTFPRISRDLKQIFSPGICVVLSERERKKPAEYKVQISLFLFSKHSHLFFLPLPNISQIYSPEINRASIFLPDHPYEWKRLLREQLPMTMSSGSTMSFPLSFKTTCSGSIRQVSMLLCFKVVFTKAHILRLYGAAQREQLIVVLAF